MRYLAEVGIRTYSKASIPDEVMSTLPSETNVLDLLGTTGHAMADRLAKQARSFSRNEMVRCFGAIAQADQALKGMEGIDDPRMVMELLVIEAGGVEREALSWACLQNRPSGIMLRLRGVAQLG